MYTISIRNMTQVNSAEIIIYSDEAVDPAYKAEVADLKMEEGSAGSLTLKVPVGNAGYDYFEELSTQVIVRKDTVTNNPDKVYWIGRLLNMKIDFNNSKELLFEGIFNYLMDTIQLPSKSECNLESWVSFLLNNHNAICTSSGEHYKKVYKGTWDISIDTVSHEFYTDYETSQEMINNAIEYDELHAFFRYVWDSTNNCYNLYLDFKKNYDASGDVPVISFGQNLMDYSRSYEPDELATVIIPRGERYSDEDWYNATHVVGGPNKEDINAPEELDHYRTVWSCATTSDHTNHDYRVYTTSTENLNKFGYVSKVMDFDGVRDYDTLLQLAQNYLANQKWIKLTIEISAIDMTLLAPDINIEAISVGRMIHCISAPHGLNYYYPCTAVEENILDVSGSRYTLGTGDVKYLTDAKRENDEKLKELVRKNIERENILTSNILNKPTNEFTKIKESIDAVETMSEEGIITVKTEAKTYALNLLNIFDEESNPNKKGYVHFLKETADYSIDDSMMSIDKIKARMSKYHPDWSSSQEDFFTTCKNIINDKTSSYVVIAALHNTDDTKTKIMIVENARGTLNGNKVCYINSSHTNSPFAYYNGALYFRDPSMYMTSSTNFQYTSGYATSVYYTNNTAADPLHAFDDNYNYPGAFKSIIDGEEAGNYTLYVSKDIYTDSTLSTLYKSQNLIAENPSNNLSFGDLKRRVNKYFPDDYSYMLNYTIGQYFIDLQAKFDNENYIIVVLLGENDYETNIAAIKRPMGNLNGEKVPYLGTPTYTAYTGGTKYFATDDSLYYFVYDDYLISKDTTNCYFYYNGGQYWFGSHTIDCKLATPAPSNWSASTFVLPNKPTLDSTDYKIFVSKNIYNADYSGVYKVKNFYNQDEPYSDERDHIYEIVISNTKDYMNTSSDNWCWRWNQYGLYALRGGYNDSILPDGTHQDANDRLRLALTYDGNIVADRITVGILNADVIKTGVIRSRPIGPDGQPSEPDGNMMIDIPNGNIIAKKGTLIFNNYRTVGLPTPAGIGAVPENEFIYISNVDCVTEQGQPVLMAVGGAQKSDWRIVSGDSFGVDKAGRVYMREGIIGATGGWFAVMANNTTYVHCYWNSDASAYTWDVTFNTDASRPLFTGTANEAMNFRFRLAHYDENNEYVFVTKLFSFQFDIGTTPKTYTAGAFYPVITPDQEHTPPFADGELFPIWYQLQDTATEDYYEQDGHRYIIYREGNNVVATSTNPNKYTTYTNVRSGSAGSNAGAVTIGSGYLSNGTFGQNRSFYLGGLKRSGTVANETRDDWRFTVGSRFGVTENGNLYCTDMYARDAHLRGGYLEQCTVTGSITATKLTNLSLKSSNPIETSSSVCTIRWRINIDPTSFGGGMFASDTDFYMYVDTSLSDLTTPNVSPTFKFTVMSEEFPTGYPSGEHTEKLAGEFTFTYNKNGESGIAQRKTIDTSSWDNPSSGKELVKKPNQSDGDVELTVLVEMTTSETSSFKFIGSTQLKTYPTQVVEQADGWTYIEGYVQVAKVNSTPRPAVQCGADFVGGSSRWLGGPSLFWAKAYVSETIRTVSGNGSSKLYKENIEPLNGRYSELFDKLKPVRYNFRKEIYDDDGKYHTGFIMEDIGESMKQLDISEDDFAAYNPDHENGGGNVRYDELIALAVDEIHSLKRRVSELEKQLYEEGIIVTDD